MNNSSNNINIRIFVACHKQTFVPDNPLLSPIQVGAALRDFRFEGMIPDDTGDNISEHNPDYCELTAQYWAWKNESCDYYGFFHYRRYLAFDRVCGVDSRGELTEKRIIPYTEEDNLWGDLSRYQLDAAHMQETIVSYDILSIYREHIDTTVYEQFCHFHSRESLDLMLRLIREMYPEYTAAADRYMSSYDVYYMNMFIMRKDIFNEYMEWLFGLIDAFETERTKAATATTAAAATATATAAATAANGHGTGSDDAYGSSRNNHAENDIAERCIGTHDSAGADGLHEPRLIGFLAERLYGIFYTYKMINGAKCAELPYIKFYNTDPDAEQKTTEFREFKLGGTGLSIKLDMRRFNSLFPAGSRRRLLLRRLFVR